MKTEFEELPRLIDFRWRTKFKKRAERKGFGEALSRDGSSISAVITHLTHAVYCSDQTAEYGLSDEEKDRLVKDRIEALPRRFHFLSRYSYFIARIEY